MTKLTKKFKETGELVRAARLQRKLTQKQLAAMTECNTTQTISNIERGTCGVAIERMIITAHILDIDPMALVDAAAEDHRNYLVEHIERDTE